MAVQNHVQTKAVVTVTEMARMVSLSRARFYQLLGTAFPFPVYDLTTRRPVFVEEMQKVCLEVRRRNCGIDGKPILFYSRRTDALPSVPNRRRKRSAQPSRELTEIVEGVRALGYTTASPEQVESAIRIAFPSGITGVDRGNVIRTVFVHLVRQNRADNLGR